MTSNTSPSSLSLLLTFCKSLYRKCRDAGGEYDEISHEVRALHTVLKHLKYEIAAPESPLNRDYNTWSRQLAPIIKECEFTLKQLDSIIAKHGRSGGRNEMDALGTTRVKLISHKSSLTLFLDTIQLHQSGQITTALDNHSGQLDRILDKVDGIAARMGNGNGNGSIMTTYEDDDKEVWKQFRRELVKEGFDSGVLQQHKDVLRAYIREIDQKGLLDENPPVKGGGVDPERWLEDVQTADFSSMRQGSEDSGSGSKELAPREENMKFPTSMKIERRKPDSRSGDSSVASAATNLERRSSEGSKQRPHPGLITSISEDKEVANFHHSTDSSNANDEAESSKPSNSLVIRTSDLLASEHFQPFALPLRALPSPTMDFRTRHGSLESVGAPQGSRRVEYGASPISGPGPSSNPAPRFTEAAGESFVLAPDENGKEIPPDAKWTKVTRRLISPEVLEMERRRYEARPEFVAILGVLSRAEIEVLAQRTAAHRHARHLRHHPPPAQSSQAQAQAQFPTQPEEEQKPIPPPRPTQYIPIPVPIPIPLRSGNRGGTVTGRDTPSTDYTSDSSNSDTDIEPKMGRSNSNANAPKKYRKKGSYQGSDIGVPISGYPNPFGQPVDPPSPAWSHAGLANDRSKNDSLGGEKNRGGFDGVPRSAPAGGGGPGFALGTSPGVRFSTSPKDVMREQDRDRNQYTYAQEPRRDRNRDRDEITRRDSDYRKQQPQRRDSNTPRRDRESNEKSSSNNIRRKESSYSTPKHGPPKSNSRWKENLTAASIGGAAVSLLNVLSEAAEGM